MAATANKPIFTFGVIADVQYADLPDSLNFAQTSWRYYRSSLDLLRNAVDTWNRDCNKVSFVAQLGDIIDGKNSSEGSTKISECALNTVLEEMKRYPGKIYHVWGNHELYNFNKSKLLTSELYSGSDPVGAREPFYAFSPCDGLRFIVLDSYDISVLGCKTNSLEYKQARDIVKDINRNKDLNSPEGLVGMDRRFVSFNGGMSDGQLNWLDGILKGAAGRGEKVIIFGHTPVYAPSSEPLCLLWNYNKLLDVMHRYDCVVAYMCGHDHCGGYAMDEHGIHHVTMEGIIETKPNNNAFATVDVFPDRLVLRGCGRVDSREMYFTS